MSNYIPHSWVIAKNKNQDYRVVAGWRGGYLDGDAWRVNSGIKSIEERDDCYDVFGYTGSCYRLFKNRHGFISIMAEALTHFEDPSEILIEEVIKELSDGKKGS